MSWGLVGAGIGAAGLGLSAYGMFSGSRGGGSINTKSIQKTLNSYVSQVKDAIAAGRSNVAGAIGGMDAKIEKGVKQLRDASDGETKAFWNNIGIFNEGLINSASALVEEYDGDVMKALETLEKNVSDLNTGYSQDMGAEISRYGTVEEAINAKLAADETVAEDKFLSRVNQFTQDYEQKSLAETDAAKTESMALGDTFMQRSQDAISRFDSAATQTPEFLQQATKAADALSKAALQTRMDLLATADPRAMELSAIADENAAAMMSGQISADVQANLARSGAMRALQGGFGGGSEMGRNLQARDLGLTSLDLQQRGAQLNEANRRLNYDTRIAGTQVNPFDVSEQMQRAETTALDASLRTAESDRNQRLGAVAEASGQRLQTFDRLFGSNMGVADTLRGQDMTLAAQLSSQSRDANIRASGMRIAATQDIYNNNLGLADTVFNTGIGLAGQKLSTGLSTAGDIYKTNIGAGGQTYTTRLGLEQDIFGNRSQAAVAGMQAATQYEGAALSAISSALGNAAATQANIPVMQAAQRNAAAMNTAQMWGSLLQSGSSLAGSFLGNVNWNAGGRTFGGGFGSAGAAASAAPFSSGVSFTRGTGYVPVAGRA